MSIILDTALPFFALIFCGYGAQRWRVIDESTVRGLNTFVYWFALPALLVPKVGASPVDRLFDPGFLVTFYGTSLIIYFLVLDYGRLWKGDDTGTAAVRALGATFSNSGYMGIPLLIAAFGPAAALPSVLALMLDQFVTIPLTIALIEASRGAGSVLATLGTTFRGVIRNPLVVSVFAGMLLAVSGLRLPGPLLGFTSMLGAAASPCALFALGASLAIVPSRGSIGEVGLVTIARMLLHPAMVWLAATYVYPMPEATIGPMLITAALPTAATVFVISQRYELLPSAPTIVLVTHLVSVVTLSALLVLFQPQGGP